jgi:hypothetical protein
VELTQTSEVCSRHPTTRRQGLHLLERHSLQHAQVDAHRGRRPCVWQRTDRDPAKPAELMLMPRGPKRARAEGVRARGIDVDAQVMSLDVRIQVTLLRCQSERGPQRVGDKLTREQVLQSHALTLRACAGGERTASVTAPQ